MKTPQQVVADIAKRLERTWATETTGETTGAWPHRFPLGAPSSKSELEANWPTYQQQIRDLKDWVNDPDVLADLSTEPRRVFTTTQDIPKNVLVNNPYAAAAVVDGALSGPWKQRLDQAYQRNQALRDAFPAAAATARVLRDTDAWTDTQFDLLIRVADWFARHHAEAAGLTPRQVPIPGVHAKWLNTNQPKILALTGLRGLGLADPHPQRIHFTYLDPDHRARGGRVHDSATVGDRFTPAYVPTIVVISENKDTAINFPPLPGGIAVEGEGFGGKATAAFPWITSAPRLLYWGDIDRHGYEILNGWRNDGVPVESILMDLATYETYEPFGTDRDKANQPIPRGNPKPVESLKPGERAVYNMLTDPDDTQHARIEQERIPFADALTAIRVAEPDESGEYPSTAAAQPLK